MRLRGRRGKIRFGLNAVKNVGGLGGAARSSTRGSRGPFSVALGLHRAGRSAGREQAGARGSGQVRRLRLDRRRSRKGMFDALEQALWRSGARAAGGFAVRPGVDVRGRAPADHRRGVREERAAAAREGDARPCTSRSTRCRRSAISCGARRTRRSAEIERRRDGEVVTVGGIVGAIKQLTTKKGEPMVFMRLDDLTGIDGGRRLQLGLRGGSRDLLERGRGARRQGAGRPQAGGRDEADRARGDAVRGDSGAARGRAPRGRDARTRWARRPSRFGRQEFPGETPVVVAISTSHGETTLPSARTTASSRSRTSSPRSSPIPQARPPHHLTPLPLATWLRAPASPAARRLGAPACAALGHVPRDRPAAVCPRASGFGPSGHVRVPGTGTCLEGTLRGSAERAANRRDGHRQASDRAPRRHNQRVAEWRIRGTYLRVLQLRSRCGCNFRGLPTSPEGNCQAVISHVIEERPAGRARPRRRARSRGRSGGPARSTTGRPRARIHRRDRRAVRGRCQDLARGGGLGALRDLQLDAGRTDRGRARHARHHGRRRSAHA